MRELAIDEIGGVSGGETHTEVKKVTLIQTDKGTLVIGTVSTDGGPAMPYADWVPA